MSSPDASQLLRLAIAIRTELECETNRGLYPRTLHALQALETAIRDEFDLLPRPSKTGRSEEEADSRKRLQNALSYQKRRREDADARLRNFQGKKIGGVLNRTWFARLALSSPVVPSREFRQWCRSVALDGEAVISHSYVERSRDALCEVIKHLNREQLAGRAAVGIVAGSRLQIHMMHLHDEAAMTLKSYVDTEAASLQIGSGYRPQLRRGRASVVQNNYVSLSLGGETMRWLTELQPLMKKNAPTLATAIIAVVQSVLDVVVAAAPASRGTSLTVRLCHLLVGDGVSTNEAAAKRVLKHFREFRSARDGVRLEYTLLVWRCASHQGNLVVHVAICGCVVGEPVRNSDLCGTCVRLYKYLMVSYIEEFAANLRLYLLRSVELHVGTLDANIVSLRDQALRLQELYGHGVLPDELLEVYNIGLQCPLHACSPTALVEAVRRRFYDTLYKLVLLIEERPVVTRFWTFTNCVWALCRMKILDLPSDILSVGTVKPQEVFMKRLKAVGTYYNAPSTSSELRRVSLCLRLSNMAVSLTAQKSKRTAPTLANRLPLLVRLGNGEIIERTVQLFNELLGKLHFDSTLDITEAFTALLVTQTHIVIRFCRYQKFPTMLWTCSKTYNPVSYASACLDFLNCDASNLDCGYSLPLRQDAWRMAEGVEAEALAFLMRAEQQEEFDLIVEKAEVTTLDVERKHNLDRRSEKTGQRVISIGRASRNSMLEQYLV